ncbi:Hint domain-containing protein [Chelatococcus reniformis]|uniref:Hedgehog/Intein (Hint) domain-containing protein n=1 Tax=Chelatococcus reniformis TaxID=1494448 RepID=A0A916U4D6_9HYPH|nr:Hint domain-containing protein [Chelatococcus reniformis]GGC58415.1 hypothetical protein GCM10010994_16680 [Chelatococcus reniformis]
MATKNWAGGGGDWNVAANWQPEGVPGAGDDVVIDSGNPIVSGSVGTVASIAIGAAGALTIQSGGQVNPTGLVNGGHIEASGGTLLVNGGEFSNTGTIDVAAGATLQFSSVDLTLADFAGVQNEGTIGLVAGSVLELGGETLELAAFGRLDSSNSTIAHGTIVDDGSGASAWSGTFQGMTYQGDLTIGGNLTVVDGLTVVDVDGQAPGTINTGGGGYFVTFPGPETIDNVIFNTGTARMYFFSDSVVTFGANAVLNVSGLTSFFGSFVNQGQVNITHGFDGSNANITNEGAITVGSAGTFSDADFINNGTFTLVAGGKANLTGPLTGTGTIAIEDGAAVTLGTVAAEQTVAVIDGRLTLTNSQAFAATIDDFDDVADVITLANVQFDAGDTVSLLAGNVLQITQVEDGSTIRLQLDPAGSYGGVAYQLLDDGDGGTDITVTCFCRGTRIATPAGEQPVETLTAGDIVLTAQGKTHPVLWIGRQTVATACADPLRTHPIRISAGALAEGVPVRDLHVSPDHALLVEGVLVQAGALVNGATITRGATPEARFTYYHIELADHALVLAEGAPAETFVDNVTRRRFDNYAQYEALFGESRAYMPELELPRIKSVRQLPRPVRERLAARAEALGLASAAAA